MSADPSGYWQVFLFGELQVTSPDQATHRVASRKAAELLAFLAIRRNPLVERDVAAEAMWPEVDVVTARNRLKQTLSVLRKELPDFPLEVEGKTHIGLDLARIGVDVHLIEDRLRWIDSIDPSRKAAACNELGASLNRGLLPGFSAEWLFRDQARFRSAADRLRSELENAVPSQGPFVAGGSPSVVKLPLIGRDREIQTMLRWLRESPDRLLLVHGPPGIGKTRLILELLDRASPYCDGAAYYDSPPEDLEELLSLLAGFSRPLMCLDGYDPAKPNHSDAVHRLQTTIPRLQIVLSGCVVPFDPAGLVLGLRPVSPEASSRIYQAFTEHFGTSSGGDWTLAAGLPGLIESAAEGRLPEAFHQSIEQLLDRLSEADRVAYSRLALSNFPIGPEMIEALLGSEWKSVIDRLEKHSLLYRMPEPCESTVQIPDPVRRCSNQAAASILVAASLNLASDIRNGLDTKARRTWMQILKRNRQTILDGLSRAESVDDLNRAIPILMVLLLEMALVADDRAEEGVLGSLVGRARPKREDLSPETRLIAGISPASEATVASRIRARILQTAGDHQAARQIYLDNGDHAAARAIDAEQFQPTDGGRNEFEAADQAEDHHAAGLYALKIAQFFMEQDGPFDANAWAEMATAQFQLAAEPVLEGRASSLRIQALEAQGDVDRAQELRIVLEGQTN